VRLDAPSLERSSGAAADSAAPTLRVLHVTECWGGGVTSAIHAYVEGAPEHDHWLLMASKGGPDPWAGLDPLLQGRQAFSAGHLARIRDVGTAYRDIQPDVVHVHSSLAGFYVRACPVVPRRRIVYTPHCYAFERADVGDGPRYGFRLAEALLARRTGVVAAVSPREAELAGALRRRQRVVYVPNVIPEIPAVAPTVNRSHLVAMTVGRICPQKDPRFLAEAARIGGPSIRWIWAGDGDPDLRRVLEAAGVTVTGWLARDKVLRMLGTADVYVHTAGWEGAPVAILEAAGGKLPVVARDIPALRSLGVPDLVMSPAQCAQAVRDLVDAERRQEAARRLREALTGHTARRQADQLALAYALARGVPCE
jgi:glycosyltransferase involved in cell wall biosynthesis